MSDETSEHDATTPPTPMRPASHPGERPDDSGDRGSASDGPAALEEQPDELATAQEDLVEPGVPERYEGSPGAALASDDEGDLPEPNDPG